MKTSHVLAWVATAGRTRAGRRVAGRLIGPKLLRALVCDLLAAAVSKGDGRARPVGDPVAGTAIFEPPHEPDGGRPVEDASERPGGILVRSVFGYDGLPAVGRYIGGVLGRPADLRGRAAVRVVLENLRRGWSVFLEDFGTEGRSGPRDEGGVGARLVFVTVGPSGREAEGRMIVRC